MGAVGHPNGKDYTTSYDSIFKVIKLLAHSELGVGVQSGSHYSIEFKCVMIWILIIISMLLFLIGQKMPLQRSSISSIFDKFSMLQQTVSQPSHTSYNFFHFHCLLVQHSMKSIVTTAHNQINQLHKEYKTISFILHTSQILEPSPYMISSLFRWGYVLTLSLVSL